MRAIAGVPVEETSVAYGGLRIRLLRAHSLEQFVDGERILRGLDVPEPPYWMHLWPAATVLAGMLAAEPRLVRSRNVIELGCGLGLPSLVAAALGAFVVASDWKRDPLRFLRASAALNGYRLATLQMDWAWPGVARKFDLCLGADVAYDAESEEGLAAALDNLVRCGGTALLADSVNTYRTTLVPRLRGCGFEVAVSEVQSTDEDRPVWVRLLRISRAA